MHPEPTYLASEPQLLPPGKGGGDDSDCLIGSQREAGETKVSKILMNNSSIRHLFCMGQPFRCESDISSLSTI